ncbi:hypothetical protein [Myroides sp. DF42-4-2]|uniref:hypothetical protein n=1 Tax=unclassified Myroides TaxID=2642485 RepID=UPI002577A79A|nr:hypothetical protein [Myroides sp. DF42-4-2]MDM1406678.1 hypothetical protein [Myroides sp. DF42-4-2]
MSKKLNTTIFSFFLLIGMCSHAQVGIGISKPTQEFEVKGTVRFQNLDNNRALSRQLSSDDAGNLTASEVVKERFYYDGLKKQFVPPVLVEPNQSVDLGVGLTVDVPPFSEIIVVLTYNIPVYKLPNTIATLPDYAGIKLISSKEGHLPLGARKFTFPSTYSVPNATSHGGSYIDGKYVDVVKNTTSATESVTYSLQGFIESKNANVASFYFSDTATAQNFGVGVFSSMVFFKAL